ncbi:hypothetical protein ABZP36_006480 [Zizania latifolia]
MGHVVLAPVIEEDRKWFMEAMQENTIDVVKRMKEITLVMKTPDDVLQFQGVTLENIEALIRHNQQGVAAFRLGNGYAALKEALRSDYARLQRRRSCYVSVVSNTMEGIEEIAAVHHSTDAGDKAAGQSGSSAKWRGATEIRERKRECEATAMAGARCLAEETTVDVVKKRSAARLGGAAAERRGKIGRSSGWAG